MKVIHSLGRNDYLDHLNKHSSIMREYLKSTNLATSLKTTKPKLEGLIMEPLFKSDRPNSSEEITKMKDDDPSDLRKEMDDMSEYLDNKNDTLKRMGIVKGMNGRRFENIYGRGPQLKDIHLDFSKFEF